MVSTAVSDAVARVYWLHALSPLHVGSGRGVGFIDLPVIREKATGRPIVPGSTMKGIMRSRFASRPDLDGWVDAAFGRSGDDAGNAGALVFSDARLVLMPVRSLYGTFAWATSPLTLGWLGRDLRTAGVRDVAAIPEVSGSGALVTASSCLAGPDGKLYLEELDFEARREDGGNAADVWARLLGDVLFAGDPEWKSVFVDRFVVVDEDTFSLLAETGTEVTARVRLKEDTKTVDSGGLWYEENLPAESVLAGLIWCERIWARDGRKDIEPSALVEKFCSDPLRCQIGGKTTVGRGLVRCLFQGGDGR